MVTLPLYDVPLAAVVAVLLVASCAGFAAAERVPDPRAAVVRIVATVPGLLAVSAALPNAVMTTVVLAVATALCVHLMRRTDLTGRVATAAFAFAFGGLVWAAADALSVPAVDRALPILLVLGGAGHLASGARARDLRRSWWARWPRSVRWRPPPTPPWPSPSISRWPAHW